MNKSAAQAHLYRALLALAEGMKRAAPSLRPALRAQFDLVAGAYKRTCNCPGKLRQVEILEHALRGL